MELKQIKDLMAAMGRTRTKRLKIKKDNFELELEREDKVVKQVLEHHPSVSIVEPVIVDPSKTHDIPSSLHPPVSHEAEVVEEPGQFITSPMVGTYYTASGTDDAIFVQV